MLLERIHLCEPNSLQKEAVAERRLRFFTLYQSWKQPNQRLSHRSASADRKPAAEPGCENPHSLFPEEGGGSRAHPLTTEFLTRQRRGREEPEPE